MADIKDTLHPEGHLEDNLYPNIKADNVPNNSLGKIKLDSEVNSLLKLVGANTPSGAATSSTILAKTSDQGLWVGTDTGKWYYWNGSKYVAGGTWSQNVDPLVANEIDNKYGNAILSSNSTDVGLGDGALNVSVTAKQEFQLDAGDNSALIVSHDYDTNTTTTKITHGPLQVDEVDNSNSNAMLRYKSTENKVVVGTSENPLTLMGSGDRPTYSKDGSDFSGVNIPVETDIPLFYKSKTNSMLSLNNYGTLKYDEKNNLHWDFTNDGKKTCGIFFKIDTGNVYDGDLDNTTYRWVVINNSSNAFAFHTGISNTFGNWNYSIKMGSTTLQPGSSAVFTTTGKDFKEKGTPDEYSNLNYIYIGDNLANLNKPTSLLIMAYKIPYLLTDNISSYEQNYYGFVNAENAVNAVNAENAVKSYINQNVIFDNYLVRNQTSDDTCSISAENLGWVKITKNGATGTVYQGVYIKISWNDISEIEGIWSLEWDEDNNMEKHILSGIRDWGDAPYYSGDWHNIDLKTFIEANSAYFTKKFCYIAFVRYNPKLYNETWERNVRLLFTSKKGLQNNMCASQLYNFDQTNYYTRTEVDELIGSLNNKYITTWGDSLTAGAGWNDLLAELAGMTLYNAGTGGENSLTIMARQGGDVMMVNNITIPAATTAVTIASRSTDGGISTQFGKKVMPLLQGGSSHINPCYLGDIEGTLTWTGSSYDDVNGTWTFTRKTAGDEVSITRPTALRTAYDVNRNKPYLQVIFIGQNGGWTDLDDLVRQHRLMIAHSNAKHTIVLGLSSGTKNQRADYEAAMTKEFGRYFISLREYLSTPIYDIDGNITSCYGMSDQNVAIDSSYTYDGKTTVQEIELGMTPHQILADSVHYTSGTKTVIGNMLYKKCKELNIF